MLLGLHMATIIPYRDEDGAAVSAAVAPVVKAGGLVAIPTETYYGLGADPFNQAAVERLIAVKGRPDGKPILVLIGALRQLDALVTHVPPAARVLIDTYWPGPLTIVLPANPRLPVALTAGTGTLGVRLTSCGPLAALLKIVGPLTGTSANRSGALPESTAAGVQSALGDTLDMIIDAGPTPGEVPSTVVRIVGGRSVELVREGVLTRDQLEKILAPHAIPLT